jgi:hypothetical protein
VAHPGALAKRIAIFVHRWIGVALCVLFLMWFMSGIVMMYWSFPEVSAADRLARAPELDVRQIKLSPDAAYATLKEEQPAFGAVLATFDGRPTYTFEVAGGPRVVYADDGTELPRRTGFQIRFGNTLFPTASRSMWRPIPPKLCSTQRKLRASGHTWELFPIGFTSHHSENIHWNGAVWLSGRPGSGPLLPF